MGLEMWLWAAWPLPGDEDMLREGSSSFAEMLAVFAIVFLLGYKPTYSYISLVLLKTEFTGDFPVKLRCLL